MGIPARKIPADAEPVLIDAIGYFSYDPYGYGYPVYGYGYSYGYVPYGYAPATPVAPTAPATTASK